MAKNNNEDLPVQNSFMSGLVVGGMVGSVVLFFLGTKQGRSKLKNIIDAAEELDDIVKEELGIDSESGTKKHKEDHPDVTTNIHAVLDKIQSSLPTRKEIQKYFVKDGKLLK